MTDQNSPSIHGYSGKPLFQKIGLKAGMKCLALNPPANYPELLSGAEGIIFLQKPEQAEVVHLFCADRMTLEQDIDMALSHVAPKGMLWISWPKKTSSKFVDLTEDGVRELVLPKRWVDVKVCAVDHDWSGLKFLRRKT